VYEGLQVDTRAKDNKDPFLDENKPQGFLDDDFDGHYKYMDEKQAHLSRERIIDPRSPVFLQSPGSHGTNFAVSPLPPTPQFKTIDNVFRAADIPPAPRERRICGLKRKHFWEIFGLVLALVIAAAVVGGVVGGLQYKNANPPNPAYGGDEGSGIPTNKNGTNGNATSAGGTLPSPVTIDPTL